MLRYAALVLLVFLSEGSLSNASGNIGCLFSETLCSQEKEWCFDDYAFGRCLPLYGNIKEEDFYRYELGTTELHLLERQMQKLFLLGYRWSHTYTQCVLQILLDSIRDGTEFDVTSCNDELDQDLEGALKAIEGEELEQVDPRNLAIVRFTPSVVNPHSDYADELYYPPPKGEILPPYKPHKDDLEEAQTPVSNGGERENQDVLNEFEASKEKESNKTKQNLSSLPREGPLSSALKSLVKPISPAIIPFPLGLSEQEPMYDFLDDYDYDYDLPYPPYEPLPMARPVHQKRSGYYGNPVFSQGFVPQELLGKKANMKFNFLRNLVERHNTQPNEYMENPPQPQDSPLFLQGEPPSAPGGDHSKKQAQTYYHPQDLYDNYYLVPNFRDPASYAYGVLRRVPYPPLLGIYGSRPERTENLPELEVPNPENYFPETIHPKYEKEPENSEESPYQYSPPNGDYFDEIEAPLAHANSVSRFDKNGEPTLKNDYPSFLNEDEISHYQKDIQKDEPFNQNSLYPPPDQQNNFNSMYEDKGNGFDQPNYLQPQYNPMLYQPPAFNYYDPYDANYYQDFSDFGDPYPLNIDPKFVKKDEEEEMEYFIPNGHKYNLERNERQDVKKPGPNPPLPGFYPQHGMHGQMGYQIPHYNHEIPLPFDYNDDMMRGMQPDMVESEHSYVDDVGTMAGSKHDQSYYGPRKDYFTGYHDYSRGMPNVDEKQQPTPPPTPEYVHVHIRESFEDEKEAEGMVDIMLRTLGLNMTNIKDFTAEENEVKFQVKENEDGNTPAIVAEKIEQQRDKIKEKTGKDIIRTGVGPKGSMTAIVYSSDASMLKAVAIVCGVCAAIVILSIVLFLLKRHSAYKEKIKELLAHDTEASDDYQNIFRQMPGKGHSKEKAASGSTSSNQPVATHKSSHAGGQRFPSLSENGNNSPSSRSSTSSWSEEPVASNMDISTGHMVLSYMEDHLRNKDRLDQEWIDLCAYEAEPNTCNIALKNDNTRKNRFSDSVPYDHNRVILNDHTNVTGSNYINASSITDHDPRNPAYIATQGALQSTTADFWQLVWEQGSVVIVMLTRLTENEQSLCHRYWPEKGSELYHIYEVHLVSEHIWCEDYLVRSFYLKNVKTGETRTVTQFHFLSWSEAGVPTSTKALLEFRRKVNKSYRGRSCPIIVHCSDGVGRTGTYCLIDMVLNRMAKGAKEIDIAATLEHIRDQRPNMVKTKLQFEFVLMAVAEEVHAILKALPQ